MKLTKNNLLLFSVACYRNLEEWKDCSLPSILSAEKQGYKPEWIHSTVWKSFYHNKQHLVLRYLEENRNKYKYAMFFDGNDSIFYRPFKKMVEQAKSLDENKIHFRGTPCCPPSPYNSDLFQNTLAYLYQKSKENSTHIINTGFWLAKIENAIEMFKRIRRYRNAFLYRDFSGIEELDVRERLIHLMHDVYYNTNKNGRWHWFRVLDDDQFWVQVLQYVQDPVLEIDPNFSVYTNYTTFDHHRLLRYYSSRDAALLPLSDYMTYPTINSAPDEIQKKREWIENASIIHAFKAKHNPHAFVQWFNREQFGSCNIKVVEATTHNQIKYATDQ